MAGSSVLTLGASYYPDPTKGRPVFNGSVFIGQVDKDPEVLANRVTVQLRQENGTLVTIAPAAQPLKTGAGGVVMYDGSPVSVLVDATYSLKVLDKQGAQLYYFPQNNVTSSTSILEYGAHSITEPGFETFDSSAAIQAAIDDVDHIYLPNANGEKYLVSATLLVKAEANGGRIREGVKFSADVSSRDDKHVIQVAAGSGLKAVIQFLDGISVNNILTNNSLDDVSIDGNGEAVFGVSFGDWGSSINQLVKMTYTQNLSIKGCRFGMSIGGASAIETDSAGYSNNNTVIEDCTDGAVLIDTGNGAAISFTGGTFNGNGYSPTLEATYNPSGEGFNLKVIGGELNLFACTTAGMGGTKPATADIIANSADIRISGHWSDTHGICVKESGGTDSSIFIAGLRHNEGNMTAGNTPISIQHVCKMTVIGSLLYGVFESNEGASGSLTTEGVNFVSGGAAASNSTAYTGTLVTNQKGVISINNNGNRAQIIAGGGTRSLSNVGFFTPLYVAMGAGSSATGPTCVFQALGPSVGDSGYTEYVSETEGRKELYVNCVKNDASGNVIPLDNTVDSFIFEFGGTNGLVVKHKNFPDDVPVLGTSFTSIFNMESDGATTIPGKLGTGPATELTIASGTVTITSWQHTIDTEGNIADDNLNVILGGSGGDILILRAESDSRTVNIQNTSGATGGIRTASGLDMVLNDVEDTWMGIYDEVTAKWLEVSRSTNA